MLFLCVFTQLHNSIPCSGARITLGLGSFLCKLAQIWSSLWKSLVFHSDLNATAEIQQETE